MRRARQTIWRAVAVGLLPLLALVAPVGLVAMSASAQAEVVVLDDLGSASAEDIVATRQSNFRGNGRAMKTMSQAVKAGDMAAVAAGARHIAEWGEIMTEYFPPRTSPRETAGAFKNDAEHEIWREWDDFVGLASNTASAAGRLAALAEAGDVAGVGATLKEVGASCGACHRKYKK